MAPYFAFFDVDYTLLHGAAGPAFAAELLRARIVSPVDMARIGLWTALYAVGGMDERAIWRKSIERLVGKPEEPIRQACESAHRKHVRHRFHREALRVLEEHRARGARLALISAAPRYSVLAIARELEIEHTATAWANVEDGRVKDLAGVEIPFGPTKRLFAERLCQQHGIEPHRCWAYGDSRSDLEMLEFVGNPVAVNPRRALRRAAIARGWRIERWRETTSTPGRP